MPKLSLRLQVSLVVLALLGSAACSDANPAAGADLSGNPIDGGTKDAAARLPQEVRVGALDNTGYFSLEISPDMKYLLWQEVTGAVPGPLWTCSIDPATAALTPADCRGFRGPTVPVSSAPQWGVDATGQFYITVDASGEFVIGRPLSATTGTLTKVGGLTNKTRQYPYPSRIATRAKSLIAYLQEDSFQRPQLYYLDLSNPNVETALTMGPVDQYGGQPSFLFTIYRWFSGQPILTYGANDAMNRLQIKEVDFSTASPTTRWVTQEAYDHVDNFPAIFGGQRTMIGGVNTLAVGAFAARNVTDGYYTDTRRIDITGQSALAQPQMACSFEPFEWQGMSYASFLALDGGRKPGSFPSEVWLTSLADSATLRRLSGTETLNRMDPEYFLGTSAVWVFYYATKGGATPSFSLYRSTTGLGN